MSTLVLLPGQGSQAIHLGRNYIAKNPDQVSTLLSILSNFNEDGETVKNLLLDEEAFADDIIDASISQILLFSIQVVLAGSMIASGEIVDPILTGYSAGELAGAVLSKSISISDGIDILKVRCESYKTAKEGKMLSVLLPSPYFCLPPFPGVEVAAVNGERNLVISVVNESANIFIDYLEDSGIIYRPIGSNLPFHHSSMISCKDFFLQNMQPLLTRQRQWYPFISAFSGHSVFSRELSDIRYWSSHPVDTLNLPDTLSFIRDNYSIRSIWEFGNGRVLSNYAMRTLGILHENIFTL